MGVGNKGLEVFEEEETMNSGSSTILCYKTNKTKFMTIHRPLWRGANACRTSAPVPKFCQSNQLCLCYLTLVGLWQKQFKGKRSSESKLPTPTHKDLPLYCKSSTCLTFYLLKRNSIFETSYFRKASKSLLKNSILS